MITNFRRVPNGVGNPALAGLLLGLLSADRGALLEPAYRSATPEVLSLGRAFASATSTARLDCYSRRNTNSICAHHSPGFACTVGS